MSHKKEIENLRSQARQHELRAQELEERADDLRYQDLLIMAGIAHNEIVKIRGTKARINSINYDWLRGNKIKKDGTDSAQMITAYSLEEIKKLEEPDGTD